MNTVSKAELARMFNVNQSRINALLSSEPPKIVETENGLIDLDNPINKAYIKFREKSVPKYTGVAIADDDSESDCFPADLFDEFGEVDLSKIKNKKDADMQLSLLKLAKGQKENQLLDLALKKELKKVVETDIVERVIIRSYDFLLSNLRTKPLQNINKLRDIILTENYKNNEDVKFITEMNEAIYKDALEETRKAMLEFYGNESEEDTC